MKIVSYEHTTDGIPRPAVYLSADGSWPEGTRRIVEELKTNQKGTIFVSPDNVDDHLEWRYRASWSGNVVAFWFSKGDARQELKMLELGIQVGRYCAGAGADRIIIGAHKDCPFLPQLESMLDVANMNLHGHWRFQVITDFKEFVKKLSDVVK
jgi:hypothetical protein